VVQIRDTVAVPFVGFAGGDLLVQGNEQVDIVALSHPESGLYAYGDMVLRSGNPVGGDAHYWSGGNFRVANLDGSGGGLYSPVDPIIRASGDVFIEDYQGSSLHVLAGGAVTIGTAEITAPDPGALGIDFLQETIALSDGTIVQIDGAAQPTLDVRAGVNPAVLGTPPLEILTGFDPATDAFFGAAFVTDLPSAADITVGDVVMAAPNGLVLLTNQYEPNPGLEGSIFIDGEGFFGRGIDARGFDGQGGAVYLDARNDVSVINSYVDTSGAGTVGDIVINAGDTVQFERQDRRTVAASNLTAGAVGTGGDIRITATNVEMLNGAQLQASTLGTGDAGNVVIEARDRVVFDNSDALSDVTAGATGAGGNVEITANSLVVINGAQLSASTFGTGDSGNVVITAQDRVVFDGTSINGQFRSAAFSTVEAGAEAAGGNVEITTNSLEVTNGAQLSTNIFGTGDAGNVVIEARDRAVFAGTSTNGQFSSEASSRIEGGATGTGGNIEIFSNSLEVTNGAQLSASTLGNGDAGNVVIQSGDRVVFDGSSANGQFRSAAFSTVEAGAIGAGGNVDITANSLEVTNGAGLTASTRGNGDAGNVVIEARDRVVFDGGNSAALSRVEVGGTGMGGNVNITANSLEVTNGAGLTASTRGTGDAGNVVIEARDHVVFDGGNSAAFSTVAAGATGEGGNVVITANSLAVTNGAQIGRASCRERVYCTV
jgi:large exoprotein involved in heme utilization and adhesion